ncbi:MAG: hypothetical protein IPJ82_16080 [Lewinellaceae bacterium]|nr:hypothetical protein [Lewinellaceae bacterium]
MLLVLLLVFRWGYEFIYRDGRRSEMNTALAPVFPQLGGIYSGPETTALYLDLKNLASRYPNFKTLPSFPMANYLTRTYPPLPLDWVVGREINKDEAPIRAALEVYHPVLLIEKRYADQIRTDPEMDLTRRLLLEGTVIGETPNFWVVKSK